MDFYVYLCIGNNFYSHTIHNNMKKYLLSLLALTFVSVLSISLSSCGDDEDELIVTTTNLYFNAVGGSQSFQIKSNTKWTISSGADWCIINPSSSSKDGTVTVNVSANKSSSQRTCQLYISAGEESASVLVTQYADKSNQVRITNNSSYTLNDFTIIFLNSSQEILTTVELGTLSSGKTFEADIPTSATRYFMGAYIYGTIYFSPYYEIKYTDLALGNNEINNWQQYSE